jgi:hypothetical protein
MPATLTAAATDTLQDIGRRHHLPLDAVAALFEAIAHGQGGMAQFNHPALGGAGQWMRGGMTMVSDMFNPRLRAQVDALCEELSGLYASRPPSAWFMPPGDRGASRARDQNAARVPPDDAGTGGRWWPPELGSPDSTGSQDRTRYAYFARHHRLAIERDGELTVFDTLDHDLRGFSQQQSGRSALTFSSQHGELDLRDLPVVPPRPAQARSGGPTPAPIPAPVQGTAPEKATADRTAPWGPGNTGEQDVIATIERLGSLREKGLLSDDEFQAKKSELLRRL